MNNYAAILNACSIIFIVTEVVRNIVYRSKAGARSADKNSLIILWIVILAAMFAGSSIPATLQQGDINRYTAQIFWVGFSVFALGYLVRWVAISQLKNRFTVNVEIQKDHQLVDTGLYATLRHPSYTGIMLCFLGLSGMSVNWLSMLIIDIPIFIALSYRIRIEEQALLHGLGDTYRQYMKRTKRLIPFLY